MKQGKIRVVDDDPSFTCLLKMNLDELDAYDVRLETRAEWARAAAREFLPDLILLDVAMPGLVGGEVLAQFRADATLKAIPVVFLSAAVGRQRVKESLGMVDGQLIFAKPASVDEIVENIERYLTPSRVASVAAHRVRDGQATTELGQSGSLPVSNFSPTTPHQAMP